MASHGVYGENVSRLEGVSVVEQLHEDRIDGDLANLRLHALGVEEDPLAEHGVDDMNL